MTTNPDQTQYTITALQDSHDYKPFGDGYAPQIVLTASRGRLENVTELNTEYLPFTAEEFKDFYNELMSRIWDKNVDVDEIVCRYFKMYYGFDVAHWGTYGYSQGDWGESFLFFPEEWQETVGWSGDQTAKDEAHNDLCRWVWGDVYEVRTVPETHTDVCNLGHEHITADVPSELDHHIYGMDQAMKFAKENNIEIEGL